VATYKVIQDIEAEDKLVGPLSFRQFVYGLIAMFLFYLSFVCIAHDVAFLAIFFLPPGLFTAFLAYPFGKDQPTEVWALAKLRFLIKPHTRLWNQSGVKEMVTINVPKRIEIHRTNGLNQTEVKSRLRALADTIDSRGWAIKNVNVNMYSQAEPMLDDSDRLVGVSTMPQEVPNYDIQASDDILDEQSNPIAQQMDQMINASTSAHRQQIVQQLAAPSLPIPAAPPPISAPVATATDQWFSQAQPPQPIVSNQRIPANIQSAVMQIPTDGGQIGPIITADEQALLDKVKSQKTPQQIYYSRFKTIQPVDDQHKTTQPPEPFDMLSPTDSNSALIPSPTPMTAAPDPAILNLANNNDLDVATIARQANKKKVDEQSEDEVVISLH
jgi:hypothetical protein